MLKARFNDPLCGRRAEGGNLFGSRATSGFLNSTEGCTGFWGPILFVKIYLRARKRALLKKIRTLLSQIKNGIKSAKVICHAS